MATHAAVGVHNNFAAGQPAIALGTADHEFAGGIDQEFGLAGKKIGRKNLFDHFIDTKFFNGRVFDALRMLGGDDDVGDGDRLTVLVNDRDLTFGIRPQPVDRAGFPKPGEFASESVGKHDGGGHQFRSFIACKAEHEPLVACTLLSGFFAFSFPSVNALGDVGGLGGEVVVDEDAIRVKDVVVVDVADATDGLANDFVDVDSGADGLETELGNGDFAAHHDHV